MSNHSNKVVKVTTIGDLTKIGTKNSNTHVYKPNSMPKNRTRKGQNGISKKDKEKGRIECKALRQLHDLSLLVITYDHCDKRLIKCISQNYLELIKKTVSKLNRLKIEYIVTIGIQKRTTYSHKFPVYDLNIIIPTIDRIERLYRDILKLWNNSALFNQIGLIEPLSNSYIERLDGNKWDNYFIYKQQSIDAIQSVIESGYSEWLLNKWYYSNLNQSTIDLIPNVSNELPYRDGYKKQLIDDLSNNPDIAVLDSTSHNGLVVASKDFDSSLETHESIVNALNGSKSIPGDARLKNDSKGKVIIPGMDYSLIELPDGSRQWIITS